MLQEMLESESKEQASTQAEFQKTLNENINAMAEVEKKNKDAMKAKQKRISDAEAKVSFLEETVEELESSNDELQATLAETEDTVSELRKETTTLKDQCSNLSEYLSESERTKEQAEKNLLLEREKTNELVRRHADEKHVLNGDLLAQKSQYIDAENRYKDKVSEVENRCASLTNSVEQYNKQIRDSVQEFFVYGLILDKFLYRVSYLLVVLLYRISKRCASVLDL
jgi:chromosome segregation ATPase